MTDQEINIAVAELCGWMRIENPAPAYDWVRRNKRWVGGFEYIKKLPDYPNDLNACAEFRSTVRPVIYSTALAEVLGFDIHLASIEDIFEMVNAKACHHCEAFLKVHNRWKD